MCNLCYLHYLPKGTFYFQAESKAVIEGKNQGKYLHCWLYYQQTRPLLGFAFPIAL